ncbi:MAG: AAA family ATPase [Brevinematales bacterium]
MKSIGVYNIKGGVGKTSAAVNLAYLASADGFRTLLWDIDPQGSATFYLHKKQGMNVSLKKVIAGKEDISEYIKKTDYENLSLLPSDFSMRNLDILLDDVKKSRKRLTGILKTLKDSYDIVIMDCPPSISLLSENVFHAADILLVPMIPTPLSRRTYLQIIEFYRENELDDSVIVPFFSMAEKRKKIHSSSMEELSKTIPGICENYIPYLSEIEKMGVVRKPVAIRSMKSRGSAAFHMLWDEFRKKHLDKKS